MKKYIKIFNSLELNRTTEDVAVDLKHLNFNDKLKYYGYYSAITILSAGLLVGVMSHIKQDEFRRALIEQANITPLTTYFYSTYEAEKAKGEKELEFLTTSMRKLEKELDTIKFGFKYGFPDFKNDMAAGTVDISMVDLKVQIDEYMNEYLITYVVKNKDKKINLGGAEFSFLEISKKVQGLQMGAALEKLQVPANTILDSLGVEKNESAVNAISKALASLANLNYQSDKFYSGLELKPNAKEELLQALKEGKNIYQLAGNGFTKNIELPRLEMLYQDVAAQKKAAFQAQVGNSETKFTELKAQYEELVKSEAELKNLMMAVFGLKNDIANYEKNSEAIDKMLENYKWKH